MLHSLFRMASPGGQRARLSVLIFHRVLLRPDPLFPEEIDASRFSHICGWLAKWFNVLPLEQAVRQLRSGELRERALAITFDDGYEDNCSVAMPILQRHGLCATFFVATGFLDGGRMWNDSIVESIRCCKADSLDLSDVAPGLTAFDLRGHARRRAAIDRILGVVKYMPPVERIEAVDKLGACAGVSLPRDLMMSSDQVLALRRGGMQIGAHTVTHPILARLEPDEALAEIAGSKRRLEALLDEPVKVFAYPNGKPHDDYVEATVKIVRGCGFDAAVSTHWGAARPDGDFFQIPRFTPWDRSALRFGIRLLGNLRARPSQPVVVAT